MLARGQLVKVALILYNNYMKRLEIIYYASVNRVEDNLAHLVEHCIVNQLQRRLGQQSLLFDCYATTNDQYIILSLTAYSNAAAEAIDKVMDDLRPIDQTIVQTELSRIEVEDDLPLYYSDLTEVVAAVNATISHLTFRATDDSDSIPMVKADHKPANHLLTYGLGVKQYSLVVTLCEAKVMGSEMEAILDGIVAKALRRPGVYADRCECRSSGKVYHFKTKDDQLVQQVLEEVRATLTSITSSQVAKLVTANGFELDSDQVHRLLATATAVIE